MSIRTHHLQIPPDLVLLIRSLVTIECVGRNLDPHFDIAAQLYPFLRDLTLRRFRPDRVLSQTVRTTEDLHRIATLLPDLLSQSLESIKRGEWRVHFDLQGFERLVAAIDPSQQQPGRRHRRLGPVCRIVASCSGSGQATLAYAGLAMAVILSLWLLWNMSRE